MTVSYRLNPLERDERGEILDFEKTWVCFTMTIKKAEDEWEARDAFDFAEWYLDYVASFPCALLQCVKSRNGVYTDILTFDRDKSMRKDVQITLLRDALHDAKMAWYEKLAAAVPPPILAATLKIA